ncbi:MAG: amidohydrolase [Gammaproteobacteria bacterium]|nr:amidohydrolase [Gammaproteobacteria bacterium]
MKIKSALVALALIPLTLQATELAPEQHEQLLRFRETIHANPELSNREFETASRIAGELRALGLQVQTGVAHTGVIGVLEGGLPGPVVAVRADMDALPVTERSGLPFASTVTTDYQGNSVGVAHACGHDIHMSVVLGTAMTLAARRETLPGTVVFVFQPAEEGPLSGEKGGAPLMLEEGLFERYEPEIMFGLHAWPDLAVGQVGFVSGPNMASADRIEIDIYGKQSHGAWPHLGTDPVVLAAQVILGLQTIPSRSIDAREPVVVSVGVVRGGQRFNIIPEHVRLEGTVRAFSGAVQDQVEARIDAILSGLTAAAGGRYELNYVRVTPYLNNDPELSAQVRAPLVATLGADNVIDSPPVMVAEDFAFFAQAIPSFYFRLGVVAPGTESGGLHTPTFRADNSAIAPGVRAMTAIVEHYLTQ